MYLALRPFCLANTSYQNRPRITSESRVTSILQSPSLPNSNLTADEQKTLKRLKTDENIVILPADKGRVTVVMDKTDYNDKMDSLVNDKQTYEVLKRDCNANLTNCLL